MEDQVQFATGWSKYSAAISTPDYYNACVPSNGWGDVPKTAYHYQPDHRNCNAYMALVTWYFNTVNYREQIGIQLTQPLTIGQKYFVSFYTVMVGATDGIEYYESPSNNIGLRLTTLSYNGVNPAPIDNFAHIRSVAVISDTVNWTRISSSIVADSAYNYVMLGSFYDDNNTDTTTLNCGTCFNWYSYYLIDDVCVSTDSILCNGGTDTIPCTTSIRELNTNQRINVYPNPTTGKFTVQGATGEIEVYDLFGRKVLATKETEIDMSTFSRGIYFIKTGEAIRKLVLQ